MSSQSRKSPAIRSDISANTRVKRWWMRLSASRQDRFAMLAPLAAVLLFLAAVVAAFGYLRLEEIEREKEALRRDVEYTQQRLRLRLLEREEQVLRIARDIENDAISPSDFKTRTLALINQHPEFESINWLDEHKRFKVSMGKAALTAGQFRPNGEELKPGDADNTFNLARDIQQPVYVQSQVGPNKVPNVLLLIPMVDRTRFIGVVLVEYSVDALYRYGVPPEVSARYAVSLRDAQGEWLAGASPPTRSAGALPLPWLQPVSEFELPVSPVGNGLVIQAQPYRTSLGVVGSGLFWLVIALSVMTAWMLLANWRHTRRRVQAQQALVSETNFRRAMENSMPTGMRAMDLQGQITYVNAAFCQMTGWSEADLIGTTAPFPYWPEADREALALILAEELAGKSTPAGFQVRVKRKDNSLFDARMYISPLIDSNEMQTGWMTSMTDITEPNKIREQLSESYERFTTVLEALDASISVAPIGGNELLFANKVYRQWFGIKTIGHQQLTTQAGAPKQNATDESVDSVDSFAGLPTAELQETEVESMEIYLPELDKWMEVRTRYLNWVDGRLAQMVIATDITTRRHAEELAKSQEQRAQNASRLITMGEMASSVAHELNQPLTAINNYCSGMISRIKNQQINNEDLISALETTAKQAYRAGQIIQRIRSFVKRSEPNRTLSEVSPLVDEALELAEIELRRRNVRLIPHVAKRLPRLLVDPILIEQVLLNLLKNASESVDAAKRSAQRHVVLRVAPKTIEGRAVVEFAVTDTGSGIPPEVMARLYEAFYSTKADGMGIGLSLCRSIVESHHGRMTAENLYNGTEVVGCQFSFWIPVVGLMSDGNAMTDVQNSILG